MWEPRRLTTLWAFTGCYRDSFTLPFTENQNKFKKQGGKWNVSSLYWSRNKRMRTRGEIMVGMKEMLCRNRTVLTDSSERKRTGNPWEWENRKNEKYQLFKFLMFNLLKAKDKHIILNKKLLEELISQFLLIRHGPHRKRRVENFFYSCLCIRCHGNFCTEQLPINDRGIYTQINTSPTSLGSKSKPSKKRAEALQLRIRRRYVSPKRRISPDRFETWGCWG
jgi:hypothetical protein